MDFTQKLTLECLNTDVFCQVIEAVDEAIQMDETIEMEAMDYMRSLSLVSKKFQEMIDSYFVKLCDEGESLTCLKGIHDIDFALEHKVKRVILTGVMDARFNKISSLEHVEELELETRIDNEDLKKLSQLTQLSKLVLSDAFINSLSSISGLVNLKEFTLSDSNGYLFDLKGLSRNIETLMLAGCDELYNLYDISNCSALTKLSLLDCKSLNGNGLELLTSLKNLWINECPSIRNLNEVTSLTNLRKLTFNTMTFVDYKGLSCLTKLHELTVSYLFDSSGMSIVDFSGVGQLIDLEKLMIYVKHKINFSWLSSLVKLENLALSSSEGANLESISALTNLQYISLQGKQDLSSASSFGKFLNLKELNLFGCQINSIRDLSEVTTLQYLTALCKLATNESLERVMSHTSLKSLTTNEQLVDAGVAQLSKLTNLQKLYIAGYHNDEQRKYNHSVLLDKAGIQS